MSQSGKKARDLLQRSVQTGTVEPAHPKTSAGSEESCVGDELGKFGCVDLRRKLEAENAELRDKVISLVLEVQSLRCIRSR
jgi:hypothetical protein